MSKVIQYKGGHNTGSPYDLPGYEYDAVNDTFKDLETGKVFDKNGSQVIEADKTATIDVASYTAPVKITPTAGNDAMAKVTVTLENIPQAGAKLYAWTKDSTDTAYFSFASAPATAEAFAETFRLTDTAGVLAKKQNSDVSTNYIKSTGSMFNIGPATYMRDSSSDVTLW